MRDLAIIGGGPAGLAATIKGASEGLNVALFEASDRFGGRPASSPLIENIPGIRRISGTELADTLVSQATLFGATLFKRAEAFDLEQTGDGTIIFDTEWTDTIEARSVLLTVGLAEGRINGPCRQACNPDELQRHGGKDVVFVGGGNSSVMLALACAAAGARVTIVAKRPLVENVSAYLLPRIEAAGIHVEIGEVSAVKRTSGLWFPLRVTTTGRSLLADVVYGFPGGVPECDWLPVELANDGKILTGDDVYWFGTGETSDTPRLPFETSGPGIFAAGDCRHGNAGSIAVAMGEATRAVQVIMSSYLPERTLPGKVRPKARN